MKNRICFRQLRSQGVSDEQIMHEMKLSHGAYWRRVKRLKEIDRQIMYDKEDRLLRTIQNCENIANDQSIDPMARLDNFAVTTGACCVSSIGMVIP